MQANFLSDLIKYENNFVDVLEPVHLNLDTVATDIEPVDSLNTSSELNNDLIKSEYDASYKNEYPTMFLNEVPDEISNVEDEAVESGYEKPEVNSDESREKYLETQIASSSKQQFYYDYFISIFYFIFRTK